MENASKALIIAGAMLLGVLILSLFVYTYNSYQSSSNNYIKKFDEQKITNANVSFTKYEATILNSHDVVTIVNQAIANNSKYYVEQEQGASKSSMYIEVNLDNFNHLEKYTEANLLDFMKQNSYQVVSNNVGVVDVEYVIENIEFNTAGYVNKIKITKK